MSTRQKSYKTLFNKLKVGVALIREARPKELPRIRCPQDIVKLTSSLKEKDREHFLCIHLDTKNTVVGIETVSIGSLNNSIVHPREVFKAAILNSAAQVVLAHNHPSGDCQPSDEDKKITNCLAQAGKLLGIEVIDHVIVGRNNYFSFNEAKLLQVKL